MLAEQPKEQDASPPTPFGKQDSLKQKAQTSKNALQFMTQNQFNASTNSKR